MAKYDPLRDHLAKAHPRELVMTFDEITALLDTPLPASAARPQFWANTVEEGGHVQREAWRQAGYHAALIAGKDQARFTAIEKEPDTPATGAGYLAATATKACRACASQIPETAKLCKECNTYQGGWRSWINLSQTTLALIVALISVATAAIPAATHAIWGNRSELHADFWQFEGDWATITVSNTGDKSGFVDRVTLLADQEGGSTGIDLIRNGADRVSPGDIFRLQFMMHPSQQDLALTLFKARSSDVCSLRILLREYDGAVKQVREPLPCGNAFAHLASLHRAEILSLPDIQRD